MASALKNISHGFSFTDLMIFRQRWWQHELENLGKRIPICVREGQNPEGATVKEDPSKTFLFDLMKFCIYINIFILCKFY